MATFSRPTFSTASYATFRPVYPTTLYTKVLLPYHTGPLNTLLDLGCGPGTVTRPLSKHFTKAIATDPSPSMLTTASSLTPPEEYPNITYTPATAESLPFLKDGEIDMAVAAQAAHWFDHDAWWKEMTRVVRKGGTVAVWGYKDCMFPELPKATRVLKKYMLSGGGGMLGDYWSQPGRRIVEERLRSVRPPVGEWEDVRRWEYEPEFTVPASAEEESVRKLVEEDDGEPGFGRLVMKGEGMLRKRLRVREVEEYVRTWSAAHSWVEKHPEVKRGEGKGDVVDWMMREIAQVEGWDKDGEEWLEKEVEIEWGHGMVMARKK